MDALLVRLNNTNSSRKGNTRSIQGYFLVPGTFPGLHRLLYA